MRHLAIRVQGLSKEYTIGAIQDRNPTIREALTRTAAAPFRAARSIVRRGKTPSSTRRTSFWALNDVSFEVAPGEVVGVIGRNGAGKSTLLKVLSRITEPTAGTADIHGRVVSLLEVGTGFHQELTGRENIYLNGAILGMKRAETDRKFDEIVEFAEVGVFIDTPVKHYSTGMHLRLAFSVAAHLEPEILLVDEVLAVGDLAFQRKCLGKMEDVASHGRTVLFVSHNLAVVKELCHSSIVLSHGRLAFRGPVIAGLAHYSQSLLDHSTRLPEGTTRWWAVSVNGRQDGLGATIRQDEPFTVEAWLDLRDDFQSGWLFCLLHDASGNLIVHRRLSIDALGPIPLRHGRYKVKVESPPLWLAPGLYSVFFKLLGTTVSAQEERATSERALVDVGGQNEGLSSASLAPSLEWSVRPESTPIVVPC